MTLTIPGHLYADVMRLVNEHGYSVEDAIAKAAANAARTRQEPRRAPDGAKTTLDTCEASTDAVSANTKPKRHKYGAKPVTIDGHRFPSQAEGRRYEELKLLRDNGAIKGLELQPRYKIRIGGIHVTTYVADFRYIDVETDETIVEDVKGFVTDVYKLKKKLVKAVHGIEIQEIRA